MMQFTPKGSSLRVTVRERDSGREHDLNPDERPTFEDGHRQGWAERDAVARQELAASEARLQTVSRQLAQSLQELLWQVHTDAARESCELAIGIAEALLRRELQGRPALESIVRDLLEEAPRWSHSTLHLCPQEATLLKLDELPAGLTVVPDSSLQPGDAVLETPRGCYDATLSSRLAELQIALAGSLEPDVDVDPS